MGIEKNEATKAAFDAAMTAPEPEPVEAAAAPVEAEPVQDAPAPEATPAIPADLKNRLTLDGWSEKRIEREMELAKSDPDALSDLLDLYKRAGRRQARNNQRSQALSALQKQLAEQPAAQPKEQPAPRKKLRQELGDAATDVPEDVLNRLEADEDARAREIAELREKVQRLERSVPNPEDELKAMLAAQRQRIEEEVSSVLQDDDWEDIRALAGELAKVEHFKRQANGDVERWRTIVFDRAVDEVLERRHSAPTPMPEKKTPTNGASLPAHKGVGNGRTSPPVAMTREESRRAAFAHLERTGFDPGEVDNARRAGGKTPYPRKLTDNRLFKR